MNIQEKTLDSSNILKDEPTTPTKKVSHFLRINELNTIKKGRKRSMASPYKHREDILDPHDEHKLIDAAKELKDLSPEKSFSKSW